MKNMKRVKALIYLVVRHYDKWPERKIKSNERNDP